MFWDGKEGVAVPREYQNPLQETDQLIAEKKLDLVLENIVGRYYKKDSNKKLWESISVSPIGLSFDVKNQPDGIKIMTYKLLESPQNPTKPFVDLLVWYNPFTYQIEKETLIISLQDLGVVDSNFDLNKLSPNDIYQTLNPVLVDCPRPDGWSPFKTTSNQGVEALSANTINVYPDQNGQRPWQREYVLYKKDGLLVISGFNTKTAD